MYKSLASLLVVVQGSFTSAVSGRNVETVVGGISSPPLVPVRDSAFFLLSLPRGSVGD